MQSRALYFLLLSLTQAVHAQKHDYIWVSGDSNTPATTTHGGILIDFNQKPVTATYRYRDLNMFVCNASICDPAGQLIAYSNGCKIARANDEIFENGDNINPGNVHHISCIQNKDGYASGIQSALFLPLPNSDSIYYLFHKQMKLINNPTDVFTENLLYSVVDMRLNNGVGKVSQKNIPVLNDTLSYGKLAAVKTSTGEDW